MWQNITVIEAQEQLKRLTEIDWSNMKQAQRKKLHKKLYDLAFSGDLKPKNFVSLTDVQKALGR